METWEGIETKIHDTWHGACSHKKEGIMKRASLYLNRQTKFFRRRKACVAPPSLNDGGGQPEIPCEKQSNAEQLSAAPKAEASDQRVMVNGTQYLDHADIKRRAIQVFHTDYAERERVVGSKSWYCHTIHPNDRFRRTFDFITVVWVLLFVVVIPFEIGFDWYMLPRPLKILLDLLDVWFAVDIVLNFRTGYILHGTVVTKPEKIVSNYLKTWFLIDFLGALPFEKIIRAEASSRKSIKLVKYFKIPKLLRISRIMKYVRDHKHVYDLVQVASLVFTLLHFGACIWMLALDPCAKFDEESYAGTDVCSQGNVMNLYVEAFHLCASMMLGISNTHIVGSSNSLDVLIERREDDRILIYILSTLYMVGGLFVVALLLSEMNAYLMGKTQASAAFQRCSDRVKHEMEYYGVPNDLQEQVKAYHTYVWIHQRQYDDKIALLSDQQMSTDLQRKLALHLFKDVVSHISFFSEVDDLLLGEICLSLRTRIFLPDDMILFKGDIGKELFIISKGVVEVLRDDLHPSKRLTAPPILLRNGSFFGEISLVMEVRRTCSVQSRTICEINVLGQQAFDAILRKNPDFARRINELVVARQLETSLSRSKQRGVDFKVARSDLDRAVEAVERNMKQGLERRVGQDNPSVAHNRIEEINRGGALQFDKCSPSDEEVEHDASHARNRSLRTNAATLTAAASDVTEICDDIARRSTTFRDTRESQHRNEKDISSNNFSDLEAPRLALSSELEGIRETKQGGRKDRPRYGADGWFPGNSTYGKNVAVPSASLSGADVDTMLVTGHFCPGRSIVDLRKVRSSILRCSDSKGGKQPHHLGGGETNNHKYIRERLGQQDDMMRELLKKINSLEADGDTLSTSP